MEVGLCIEMALSYLPFEERLSKAADLGFKNVEMWFVDGSFQGTPDTLRKASERAGLRITNTVVGSPDGGVGGGLTNPSNRQQWLQRTRMTLEFNKAANIPATIVCTGNAVSGMTDQQMENSVLEGLKPSVELAEKAGITLLLEPLNTTYDHAGYWLASSDRGAAICRKLGSPRMRLLFDCYHMQIMEGDLVHHIRRNFDAIGHFHSAGVPGRNELFRGEIDYPFILRELEWMSYRGVFGLEYMPSMDHGESITRTLDYLRGGERS